MVRRFTTIGRVAGGVAGAAALATACTAAGGDEAGRLPERPAGALGTAFGEPGATNDPAVVADELTARLPRDGRGFVVVDCVGPGSSIVHVRHGDGRPWAPAEVAEGARHVDAPCGPGGARKAYALHGGRHETVHLVITGGPAAAYRVTVTDTAPNRSG